MNIKVLGTGCKTCKQLHESVVGAIKDLGLDVEVEYINDVQAMLDLGVMSGPVLAINDVPVIVGQIPSFEKIKQLIADNQAGGGSSEIKVEKSSSCGCGGCCKK